MLATKHAPGGPFRLFERRQGLTEVVERGGGVRGDRHRVAGLRAGIVLRGVYMGSLVLGATRQDSMGYTFVAVALNALRFALSGDAETIGVERPGLLRRVPIARRRRVLRDARAVGAPLPVVTSYP